MLCGDHAHRQSALVIVQGLTSKSMYSFKSPNLISASNAFLCCKISDSPSWPKVKTIFLFFDEDNPAGGMFGAGELQIRP